jgi:hypothetical protein
MAKRGGKGMCTEFWLGTLIEIYDTEDWRSWSVTIRHILGIQLVLMGGGSWVQSCEVARILY